MKDKQAKYPQLRFKGFTDPWEERRLSEIVTEHNSGVYIAKDEYGSGTNIIGVGDIYESDLVDGQVFRLAPVKDEKFILHSRDLLYGESSLVQEGIARVVSVTDKGAGTAFAWHTRRFVVEPVVADSQFVMLELNYWFPAREHLMRTATKTALTGITTQDFFSTNILVPILLEQKKICDLVRLLDNLITVNQRKLAKLKELKQGYLQKLFPKNGAKVPELRFAGFADAWVQRNLGEWSDVRDGTHASPKYIEQGHPMVTSKNLTDSGLDMSDVSYLTDEDFNEINQRSKVDIGDILFGMIGTIGKPVIVDRDDFAIKNVALIKEKTSPEIINTWLIQYLNSPSFERFIQKENAGGTQKFIALGLIRDMKLMTPSVQEQARIGELLNHLDNLIAANQRKLDLLKEQKKGFLQKMFV